MIEITRLAKAGGPLTKHISLSDTGTVVSDGSACAVPWAESLLPAMPVLTILPRDGGAHPVMPPRERMQ
jgi:hypothetical protein